MAQTKASTAEITTLDQMEGLFVESLKRSSKDIKTDRAISIAEEAQIKFKRQIEDIEYNIKSLKRIRDARLDMSPTETTSLMLAKNFNGEAFAKEELNMALEIRNEEIKYELMVKRYNVLFGNGKNN